MPHLTNRICLFCNSRFTTVWISSLLLLLQRSPVAKLLLDLKERAPAVFADVFRWSVATVSGLGAYNSVAGATVVSQVTPVANSSNIPVTAGLPLSSVFQVSASTANPGVFVIEGALPSGLVQQDIISSKITTISGITTQVGSFPITITAWEFAVNEGRTVSGNFTLNVVNPPAPTISQAPAGVNAQPGDVVLLTVGHSNGQTFTWKRNGQPLPQASHFLVTQTSPRRFFIPSATVNPFPANEWRTGAAFDDSGWTSVSGGIGYDTNTVTVSYLPFIASGGNVQALMSGAGKSTSAYLRIPFDLSSPGKAFSFLKFRHQSDDGFVAFLNGTPVAQKNNPGTLAFNSAATADSVNDSTAYTEVNVSQHLGLLRKGQNLLAVHGLNRTTSSSDFLFNCELIAGIDAANSQRLALTGVGGPEAGAYVVTVANPGAEVTSSPVANVTLPDPLAGWKTAKFTVGDQADPLVSGPDADPDGDGLPNLLEFALGKEPKLHDGSVPLRPVSEVPLGGGASQVVLRVPHVADLGSVSLRFQTAPSLVPAVWTDVVDGVNGATVSNSANQLELRLSPNSDSVFVRLVATAP